MELSNKGELEIKIEALKKETGLSDREVKKLFVDTYLLPEEEKDPDAQFEEMLHKKKKEPKGGE